jgi:hypothetical protein
MASRRRDLGKERAWREFIRRQVGSGLSVRTFCGREGRSEASFYFWQRTIRQRDGQRAESRQRMKSRPRVTRTKPPRSMSSSAQRTIQPSAFVPAVITSGPPIGSPPPFSSQSPRESAIVIELAGGRTLRLPEGIAPSRLADLVAALEARDLDLEARVGR